MARRVRDRFETVAIVVAALVAGMTVTTPVDFEWAAQGSTPNLQLMLFNVPRTAACAAMAAVLVSVVCVSVKMRTAWLIAAGCALMLVGGRLVARAMNLPISSTGFADTIVGGALLGALPALAGSRRAARFALLLGALSGIIIAGRFATAGDAERPRSMMLWGLSDLPSMVLIAAALVLLGWCGWTYPRGELPRVEELPLRPVAAVLVLMSLSLLRTDWLAGQDSWSFRMAAGLGLTVIAIFVAALLLPGRDGVVLALAMAFTVAGGAVIAGPLPAWTLPLLIAAVATGLAMGGRWHCPAAAVIATVVLVVFATGTRIQDPIEAIAVASVVGIVGGYCLAVVVPGDPSTTVVALVTMITPSVVAALVNRRYDHIAVSKVWFHSPSQASWAPGWAAVVVTISAGIIALAVPRLRGTPDAEPEPGAPPNLPARRATAARPDAP